METQDEPVGTQNHTVNARDIELSDVEVSDREGVRRMLTEFEDMWEGQLGDFKGRSRKIDLIPGAHPQAVEPYQAGENQRKRDPGKHIRAVGKESERDSSQRIGGTARLGSEGRRLTENLR